MIDKNELLDKYSDSMGNSESKFIEYAKINNIKDYQILIDEFKSIQNQVYSHIYQITEPNNQLAGIEIENICLDFCKEKIDWINEKGILAVNRWLIWICWHEGILKKT